jgi:heptosyltransferase III
MARTLVIHPGALGDVLLAIPALRALRRRGGAGEGRCEVVLAAQSHVGELLHALGEVDACVRFDALGLEALFVDAPPPSRAPRLGGAERVVSWFGARDPDFGRRLRELVPRAVVAPTVSGTGTVWEHLLATARGAIGGRGGNAGERESGPALHAPAALSPGLAAAGRHALGAAGWDARTPLVVVHPGAGGPDKRWPVERFAQVLAPLEGRFTVAVHEGPADAAAAAALRARLRHGAIHLDNPALPVLAGALAHAGAYIGNDSGVSHLAAAVGVRSVVLFRPDLLGWVPWSPAAEVVVTAEPVRHDVAAAAAALARALVRAGRQGGPRPGRERFEIR